MDGKTDHVALLNSARNVKQQIDEFLRKNQNEIDHCEVTRIRKSVEKILNAYLPRAERNGTANSNAMCAQRFSCDQHSAKSKMKELLDISSSFCAGIDTIKSGPKQKANDKKECQKVTNDDCSSNKRQTDLHEKVKHFEEHIKELDCCLREFAYFMIKLIRLSQDHQKREISLEKAISTLKNKECHYKSRIQRLSKKLDYARKTSDERQQRADGMVSKIEQLKRMAEKNATDWTDMAKSITSVAVDLSLSCRQPTCDDRLDGDDDDEDDDDDDNDDDNVDYDDNDDDNGCDYDDDDDDDAAATAADGNSCDDYVEDGGSTRKNTGNEPGLTLCCQSADGPQSFIRSPVHHSTPIRSRVDDYPCPTTTPAAIDDHKLLAFCSSSDTAAARVAEKSSKKAEPPTPCRCRPSSNPFRQPRRNKNGTAGTQSSNGTLATHGADPTAGSPTTNCFHCNSLRVCRTLECEK